MDRAAVVAYLIQSFNLKASFRQRCISYVSTVISALRASACPRGGGVLTDGGDTAGRTPDRGKRQERIELASEFRCTVITHGFEHEF